MLVSMDTRTRWTLGVLQPILVRVRLEWLAWGLAPERFFSGIKILLTGVACPGSARRCGDRGQRRRECHGEKEEEASATTGDDAAQSAHRRPQPIPRSSHLRPPPANLGYPRRALLASDLTSTADREAPPALHAPASPAPARSFDIIINPLDIHTPFEHTTSLTTTRYHRPSAVHSTLPPPMASQTSFLPEMDDHPSGSRGAFRRSTSSLKRFTTNFRLGSTPDTLDIPSLTQSLRERSGSKSPNSNSQASISTPAASQVGSPRMQYLDKHPLPQSPRSTSRMSDSRMTSISAGTSERSQSSRALKRSPELRSDPPPVHRRYMRERGAASAPTSPSQPRGGEYDRWGNRISTTLQPPASARSAGSGSQGRSSFSPLPLHRSEHSDSSAETIPATPVLQALPDPAKITAPFPSSVEAMDALVDSLNGSVPGASSLSDSLPYRPESRHKRRAERDRERYERYLYAPPLPKPPEGVTLGIRARTMSEDSIDVQLEREELSTRSQREAELSARSQRERQRESDRDRERERERKERKDRERRERIRERDRLVEKDKERERERRRERRRLEGEASQSQSQSQSQPDAGRLRSREEREEPRPASRLRTAPSRDKSDWSRDEAAAASPRPGPGHSRSASRLKPAVSEEWDKHLEQRELTEPVRKRKKRDGPGLAAPSAFGTREEDLVDRVERGLEPEMLREREREREGRESSHRRKESKSSSKRRDPAPAPAAVEVDLPARQRRDAVMHRSMSDLRCLSDDPASPPSSAVPLPPAVAPAASRKSSMPFPTPLPNIREVPSTPQKPRVEREKNRDKEQGLPRSRSKPGLVVPEREVANSSSLEHIGALVRRGDSPADPPPAANPPPLPVKDTRRLTAPTPAPIRTSGSSLEPLPSPSVSSPPTSPGYETGTGTPRKSLPPTISEIIRTHGAALNRQSSFGSPRSSIAPHSIASPQKASMLSPQKEAEEGELSHRSSLDSIAEEVRRTLQLAEDGSVARETRPYGNGKSKSASEPPVSAVQSRVQVNGESSMPNIGYVKGPMSESYSPSIDSNFPAGTSFLPLPAGPVKGASSENLAIAQQLRSPRYTKLLTLKRSPHRGLTVSLADVGSSTGHPVFVFLGLGCVRYIVGLYDEMAEALGLRLVCVDRWGLGKTDDVPAEKRGLLEWAAVMEEVADAMDIGEFSMLAHSAGAPYSLATALRLGRRVGGSIHLLAPWVSTTVEGGYKWLKYVPNGLLKTAQAAEWKVQGWMLGKPPTIQYQGIGYNATTGASTGVDSRPSFQFSDYDDLADFDGRFGSHTSLQPTIGGITALPPVPPTPPTSNEVSPKGVVKHKTSKGIMGIFRGGRNGVASPKAASSATSTVGRNSRSFIPGRRHSNAGQSIMSVTSTLPSLNLPTIEQDDVGLGIQFDILEEYAMTGTLPTRKSDGPPTINPRAGLGRRSISLTSRNSSGPGLVAPSLVQRANTTPSAPSPKPTGKSITLADALVRASHAESLKGGTADLLAILERDSKPWGFSYTDIRHPVLVWYGEKDEKISISSVRWMERAMMDCKVKIVPSAGHSLLTNAQVMVEALESIAKECVSRDL
ncbi:alpha/beta-hydrolase [Calocera viscosa TUFC12733]|uniref:Alpha/beta-hydrolase n=1 Tax=Calocera viscosa (strain TUFC12733) TaxID=1330018 RepID=A0A167LSA4_CALVF|nr:alpha/beta-hydrolase [Calocera viscosa TUFC12733]